MNTADTCSSQGKTLHIALITDQAQYNFLISPGQRMLGGELTAAGVGPLDRVGTPRQQLGSFGVAAYLATISSALWRCRLLLH